MFHKTNRVNTHLKRCKLVARSFFDGIYPAEIARIDTQNWRHFLKPEIYTVWCIFQIINVGNMYMLIFQGVYCTPWTNIAPARRLSQKETSLPIIYFQVLLLLVSGRVLNISQQGKRNETKIQPAEALKKNSKKITCHTPISHSPGNPLFANYESGILAYRSYSLLVKVAFRGVFQFGVLKQP